MSIPLHLLVVGASEAEVAPLARELHRHGYVPEAVHVDNVDAMRDALQRQAWDVVIADHGLSRFSSQDALRVLQESGLDLPFIIVSETTGEEAAVTAMKAGAHDYVMKDHLTRLGPAVERELQEAEVRRNHKQAQFELKKLSSAVNQTANSVLIADPNGVIEYVNPAFERTTGYARDEVIGKTPRLLKSGKHDQKYYETLWNTVLAGETFFAEFVNRKKSGELYHTEQSITPIRDTHGRITHFVSTGRDISERALAEEARKLFRALVDQSNDAIEVVDPETGRFLDVNEKGHLALGYSREEFLALSVFDLDSTVSQSAFPRAVEELRKSGVLIWEGIHRRKDGSTFPVEVNLKYVRLGRDYIVTVVRDVTERKRVAESLRESEERFRDLFENANDLIQSVRPDGTLLYVNRAWRETLGYSEAEIPGLSLMRDIVHPSSAPHCLEIFQRLLAGDSLDRVEAVFRAKDGRAIVLEGSCNCHFVNGQPAYTRQIFRDITERARSEAAFKLFRTLVDQSNDTIEVVDPETGRFLDVNEKGHLALGYSREEFLALSVYDVDPTMDRSAFPGAVEELRKSSVLTWEGSHRRKDGSTFQVEVNLKYVRLDRDYVVAVVRDITERQRAEEALRESEDRYRLLVEESPEAIGIYQEGKLVFINSTGARQLGAKSKEELLGRKSEQFIHPDDFPASLDRVRRRLAGETGMYPAEVRYRRLDGTTLPVEVIATPITFGGKAAVQFIARDITERKQAEQHLRDSAALYHSLVENLPQHVFRKDRAGRFTFGNGHFCQSLGKPLAEILGKTDLDLFPAPLAAKYQQDDQGVVQTGQTFQGEEEHRQANGKTIIVNVVKTPLRDAAGQIIGVQGMAWDITEKKQLEAQLRRTQRLESIGTLASGVAHDLNNALAPILMSIEMMRLEFPDTASRYLELIQGSAKRGADMVKQLLTFAKGAEGERVLVQPKHLFKEMQKLITSTFPKNIELRTQYAKDLQTILGDATQLHQVLLNLCVNARDAMPEGGTLTLEAENVELDAAYARAFLEAKPGHYVVWRVADSGAGIPPEILDRIFEPFFSTKSPDKGTGLGLSTALAIVRGHGGFVRVYSNPGQGSTFAVYLPACGSGTGDTSRLTQTGKTFLGHGEFILVVDDDAAVRDITRAVLTALNFKVLTAANGTAALIQVAERRTELRAVITDLHMPGMDGLFFVRVLQARLPQAGIIVASGRVDERELDEFKKLGVHAVLEKPFTQEKLVEALKSVFQK